MRTASPSSPEDASIAAAVWHLMEAADETVSDLAYHTRISPASLYRKLGGQAAWKATDIGRVARHFQVSPGDLFAGAPAGAANSHVRARSIRGLTRSTRRFQPRYLTGCDLAPAA